MSTAEINSYLHTDIAQRVSDPQQAATMEAFLRKIMHYESGSSLTAKNPNSTATGLFQFTKTTWQGCAAPCANIYDPKAQCDAAVTLSLKNAVLLENQLGRKPTEGEYYLAHFLGGPGAVKALKAGSQAMLRDVLPDIIAPNSKIKFHGKSFANFKVGDLVAMMNTRMDVDLDARASFQTDHDEGKTSEGQNEEEAKKRRKILDEMGLDLPKPIQDLLASDNILGQIFMFIVTAFMEATRPSQAPDQTAPALLLADSRTVTVPNLPAKSGVRTI